MTWSVLSTLVIPKFRLQACSRQLSSCHCSFFVSQFHYLHFYYMPCQAHHSFVLISCRPRLLICTSSCLYCYVHCIYVHLDEWYFTPVVVWLQLFLG